MIIIYGDWYKEAYYNVEFRIVFPFFVVTYLTILLICALARVEEHSAAT